MQKNHRIIKFKTSINEKGKYSGFESLPPQLVERIEHAYNVSIRKHTDDQSNLLETTTSTNDASDDSDHIQTTSKTPKLELVITPKSSRGDIDIAISHQVERSLDESEKLLCFIHKVKLLFSIYFMKFPEISQVT